MTDPEICNFIFTNFEKVESVDANGDTFFFYDPKKMMPFVTLVRSDVNDTFSNLNREGVFRLNIGVSKETFQNLFPAEAEYDFTALDTFMPHPVYGKMHWISILNPSDDKQPELASLVSEAYELSLRRHSSTS